MDDNRRIFALPEQFTYFSVCKGRHGSLRLDDQGDAIFLGN
ncbi:MAG: hypothetical protein AAGA74_08015 [Pseudomonadota bacterium]